MRITGFIWLEDIVEKLARKHNVQQREVRELFANRPHFRFVEKGIVVVRTSIVRRVQQIQVVI